MAPDMPAHAPVWAMQIYYTVIAVCLALAFVSATLVATYITIRSQLSKLRGSNHSIANGLTGAIIATQQNGKRIDTLNEFMANGGTLGGNAANAEPTPSATPSTDNITAIRTNGGTK